MIESDLSSKDNYLGEIGAIKSNPLSKEDLGAIKSDIFPKEDFEVLENSQQLDSELKNFIQTEKFKKWFGDWEKDPQNASKIIDQDGKPLIVYIGAPANIKQFFSEKRVRTGDDEIGYYSTKNYKNAKFYAQTIQDPTTDEKSPSSIYYVFLNVRRPLVADTQNKFRSQRITQPPKNFDGIINDHANEIVVFDPKQIFILKEERIN